MAKSEQVNVDLTATDKASDVIGDVADAAEKLEKLTPEIDITADGAAAAAGISEVEAAARALAAVDAEVVLRAKVDAARADLKAFQTDLKETGDRAETTAKQLDRVDGPGTGGGIATRGNAIADLTGPLGEASGAASDFAGVFDGLGDIATDVAGKMGASDKVVGQVGAAMGGLGIAVAAGAALWSVYQGRQQKAREEAEKLLAVQKKLNTALQEQDPDEWAAAFEEGYGSAIKVAERLGISVGDATRFITGQTDAIPGLTEKLDALRTRYNDGTTAGQANALALDGLVGSLEDARVKYGEVGVEAGKAETTQSRIAAAMPRWRTQTDQTADASGDLAEQQAAVARETQSAKDQLDRMNGALEAIRGQLDMEQALADFASAFDRFMWMAAEDGVSTAQDIRDIKQAVIDAAEAAGMNPIILESTLKAVDQGDMDRVKRNVENAYALNPVQLATLLKTPTGGIRMGSSGGSAAPTALPPAPVAVTMNVPRGYRGDLLSDARRAARRTGRYYQRGVG